MLECTVPMDETAPSIDVAPVREGFAGQRMFTLPTPVVRQALSSPVTGRMVVTDAGFFPHAARHARSRPHGARQAIVMVCTDGAGWCRMDGDRAHVQQRHRLQRGDAVVIPQGVGHAYGADRQAPWSLWWLHVTGADVPELVRAAHESVGGPVAHLGDPAPLASLVSQAIDALDLGTTGGLVKASGAAWHLMAHLVATGRRPQGERSDPVERAIEHLRATTPRRTSVAELAAMVGLGTSHFTTLFRDKVGVPPLRYQANLRMATARELLDSTEMSVSEVAHACGFDDPLYFSRQFSQAHQVSPTAYRRRVR